VARLARPSYGVRRYHLERVFDAAIHRLGDGMTPLFRSLDSAAIATEIRPAQHSVCYAAPGIQSEPANAMVDVARRIGPDLVTVCLDFDERVMRMGFGDLAAVKTLREAGIVVNSTAGLRTGLVIVDPEAQELGGF
jgi:hypothetical protein